MEEFELSPGQKAQKTSRWAKTMTKWWITYTNKQRVKWQFVEFGGETGSESYGIVDFLAIRKNYRFQNETVKPGDLFDIVLIQTKGGSARFPTQSDKARLREVAIYHNAKAVILAEWKKGRTMNFYKLELDEWILVEPNNVFE